MMEARAHYSEDRLAVKTRFEIQGDRLHFSESSFRGAKSVMCFELSKLSPDPDRVWVRNTRFETILAWILIGSILISILILQISGAPERHFKVFVWGFWIVLALALLCIITFLLFPRRTKLAIFKYKSGEPALYIGKCGKDRERFSEFINKLRKQIQAANDAADGSDR